MNDRQLIADLLSALEYHTEQTRPVEFSRVAIQAAREHLRKPASEWVGLTAEEFQMIYDMGRTPAGMMEMVEAKLKEKNNG